MLFNSAIFPFFLAVALLLYYASAFQLRLQNVVLVLLSCWFYGCWDPRFLTLLGFSTLVAYLSALLIARSGDPKWRRRLLALSLTVDLAILAFFKYFNFFLQSLDPLVGEPWDLRSLEILLPVGISFYTFHTMSYVIDVYRRDIEPTRDPIAFAVYVSFFPLLVAGPIERAGRFLPQVEAARRTTLEQVCTGTYLVLWGMFLKVFVGDNLAPMVGRIFANPQNASSLMIGLGVVAFTFQIYADFAGYSTIARGLARLMGFELSLNFNLPYLAQSPIEFWRRWHITLSTWLRDYLYIPLGGSRGGPAMTYRNLILTMGLGGLWHGAGWNFVVWGIYQGGLLCMYHAVPWLGDRPVGTRDPARWRRGCAMAFWMAVNLGFWMVGMAIFRAEEPAEIPGVLSKLLAAIPSLGSATGFELLLVLKILFYVTPLVIADLVAYFTPVERWMSTVAWPLRALWYLYLFYAIVWFGGVYGEAFVYFRF